MTARTPARPVCWDVPTGLCHECDQPLAVDTVEITVGFNDESGWHEDGVCYAHPECVATERIIR